MIMDRFKGLDIYRRELFTAIYGLNSSSEVYITPDLRIHNMREALYIYLKELGYSVIFYDDKAFSYEEAPLLKFFNFTARKDESVSQTIKRDFFRGKGPMSKTRNMTAIGQRDSGIDVNISHHDSIRVESSGNQKRFIVFQSEGIFKDIFAYASRSPKDKLAVVFVSPLTLTFDEEQRKVIINKWNELTGNSKRNKLALRIIALYDFASPQLFTQAFDSASDELFFLSPFKDLIRNDIGRDEKDTGKIIEGRKDKTVFYLGAPGRDEISHMLNYKRLLTDEGLPHLFGKLKWDHIVLRLWQGALSGTNNLMFISDYMECDHLDEVIERLDTVRAIDKLNNLEGIDNIRAQFALYRKALLAHRKGSGSGRFRPHMALMGSPGTGKSTVARLFGDILREDGLLPKGHFVKVSTDELIGQYIGETRPKTRAVCERAKGGVLFIDEAYGLMSGKNSHGDVDYGAEAIEVLIQFMEDNDDSLVILAGYTDEIKNLINEGNKGFRRRFTDLGVFEFRDYSPDVLFNISSRMIKVPVTDAFRKALKGIIRYKWAYRNKKFGNAGDMENLVNLITSHYATLDTDEPLDVKHLPEDLRLLVDESALNSDEILADLNGFLGQEGVKREVRDLFEQVIYDRSMLQQEDDYIPEMPDLNYLFTGNPGTGKTTIARLIGKIFRRLGIFPPSKDDVLTEISSTTLLSYSPNDIETLFEKNIGKVLFIDEAYELKRNSRVLTDIVVNMTKKSYIDKLSVIMAGYTDDILEMIVQNKGANRRFKVIQFTDYTNEELYEILLRMLASKKHIIIDAAQCRKVGIDYFASIERDANFGNAGIAKKLMKRLINNRSSRYNKASKKERENPDFKKRILPVDFPNYSKTSSYQEEPNANSRYNNTPTEKEQQISIIDCTIGVEDRQVKAGSDIYSAVGLIESGQSSGTAFIISVANRYIVTASHVVECHGIFSFTLNMENVVHRTKAHLLWNHSGHDLAILEVDSLPKDAKQFGFDLTTPRHPATPVRIISFPFGTQISHKTMLTSGEISNYEKSLLIRNESGQKRRFDAIRTEAQATHGSSGGPVVLAGTMQVIGVLHGGMNEGGFFMNIASDIAQLFEEPDLKITL